VTTAHYRVAYLVKRFPRLSETFVLNEFLQLREHGLEASLYALLDPAEAVIDPVARGLMPELRYLNLAGKPWRSRWRLLRGATTQAVMHPVGLARVTWALLSVHRSIPSLRHATEGLWLARELRREGVSHLHAHFAHSPAAVAYLCRLAGGPPFSFTAHAKDLYTTLPRNLRIRAHAARFVVTCTESNARFLRDLIGDGAGVPIHVVHHGTDIRRFHPARRRPESGLILAIGRLVPKKGYETLLEALSRVMRDGREFRLEVYGGGPQRTELEKLAGRLGLGARISFHGARPPDEIIDAYARAALFVLAPHVLENGDRDGIPNVLVEAMAAGVPVVSTRMSGIPELIEDGIDGLLVEPDDIRALAAAIGRLLDDTALADRLAAAGRRKVEVSFDLIANSKLVFDLLISGSTAEGPASAVVVQ
jgi:glycosyltransferase involved in cell wall biosynthesis